MWFCCSLLGWRIGWAIAPSCIATAIRNIHIKLTDSAPAPFQEAALTALTSTPEYFKKLKNVGCHYMWKPFCTLLLSFKVTDNPFLRAQDYQEKRDFIIELLESVGFNFVFKPKGSFFIFAQLPCSCTLSDVCTFLYYVETILTLFFSPCRLIKIYHHELCGIIVKYRHEFVIVIWIHPKDKNFKFKVVDPIIM